MSSETKKSVSVDTKEIQQTWIMGYWGDYEENTPIIGGKWKVAIRTWLCGGMAGSGDTKIVRRVQDVRGYVMMASVTKLRRSLEEYKTYVAVWWWRRWRSDENRGNVARRTWLCVCGGGDGATPRVNAENERRRTIVLSRRRWFWWKTDDRGSIALWRRPPAIYLISPAVKLYGGTNWTTVKYSRWSTRRALYAVQREHV